MDGYGEYIVHVTTSAIVYRRNTKCYLQYRISRTVEQSSCINDRDTLLTTKYKIKLYINVQIKPVLNETASWLTYS